MTLSRKDHGEMLRVFFKSLLGEHIETSSKIETFKKLCARDEGEYRVPLWLPLSLEEKLDILLC